jgi:hypothetical protein
MESGRKQKEKGKRAEKKKYDMEKADPKLVGPARGRLNSPATRK